MANNENLSANIDISVGVDASSLKKAKQDIASIGTAVDIISEKFGSIGSKRPASFKGIEQSLEAAFASAFERAAKAGYKFSIDARTGTPSLSPIAPTPYAAEQRRVKVNKYGGDKYLPIDQLSPSGQDTAAIRQMILASLRTMGFTGIKDFIVGGLTTAEEALKSADAGHVFVEELGSWTQMLDDEMQRAQAEWLNREAKKMADLIGKAFLPDAMSTSGQASDFQINDQILSALQNGGKIPKKVYDSNVGGGQDAKLLLQDFIAGPGGVPVISPQTFLVAVQDAMKNIPNAQGRSVIGDQERVALQKEIEKELGVTFDQISEVIGQIFDEYDYSTDDKNAARRRKRQQDKAAAMAQKQKQALSTMLISTPTTPGGGISPFPNDGGFYQLDEKELLVQQIKKQTGAKDSVQFEAQFTQLIDDYITNLFKNIAEQAYAAGEKAISNQMSNYGELAIGDPTGALDNMQEYVDRNIIQAVARLEEKYGLRQGAFATAGRGILPQEYQSIVNTAWQTNLPGLAQSRPAVMPGPGTSIWADGEAPIGALRAILAEIKAEQKLIDEQTRALSAAATVAASTNNTQGAGQAVVESVANTAVEALRGAYNSPEFQKLKNVIGSEIFDQLFIFMGESLKKGAGGVTAAWDTEFTDKLKTKSGTILESSLVLKNALGEFLNLQTFMHRPAYLAEGGMGVAGLNQAMYVQGAGAGSAITSVKSFNDRAKLLGIPESELGDLKNAEKNQAELEKKISALLALINLLDQLQVPLVGQNIMNADFGQLQNTVGFLQSKGSHLRATGGLSNIVDNAGILKALQGSGQVTDPGVMFATANKGNLGQGKLLQQLFKDFKDATAPYAKMVEFSKNGFTIKIDGKELPAHTAQADAIASIIVTEVLRQVSPQFRALMDAPGYNWLPSGSVYSSATMPYPSPSKSKGKSSKPSFDMQQRSLEAQTLVEATRAADQQASPAGQAAMAEAKLQHVLQLYKAIQSVITGTATDSEKTNADIQSMLKTLFAQTEKRAAVLSGQSVRTKAETEELDKSNRLLELRKTLLKEADSSNGNILSSTKTLYQINRELVDDYTLALAKVEAEEKARSKEEKTLDRMHATLSTMLGQKNLPVSIGTVGYSGSQATNIPFASTQMANPFNQQAGSVFSKQIQAQMKEYVDAEKKVESVNKNLINTWVTARYALYDVGNAFQNVSNRMFMLSRQIFNITDAYRSYETAFMPVERAMGLLSDETQGMLDQFIKLSQTIPLTVEELARIATLGAQMGIGASGIVKFTETVSQFSAITGMTADTIAEKFGRIAQLTKLESDQMSNLGSSIAYAGVNAVATEPQILSLAEAIAAVSQRVGILPAEVIGLSTSLASLGVPAEQARGVFTRLFGKIDRAVADGGPTLQKFAKTAGVSADEFKNKWGEAGQSYDLIRGILQGVNASGKDLTKVFDSLGITETREVNTLTRMAKNLDVVDKSMSDATKAFASNIFLQQAFGKTAETVDSKMKLFQNSIQSFGAEIGQNLAGSFKVVLESLTNLMHYLKVIAGDPVMQVLAGSFSALMAFGGVAAGVIAVLSKITAQIYAFRVAMVNTANDPTAVTGIGKQLRSLLNYKTELIEMREGLQSPNAAARGQITPISYGMSVANSQRGAYLQQEAQIYRATGMELQKQIDEIAVAEGKRNKVREFGKIQASEQLMFARMEADQINQLVRARAFEITALETEISKKVQSGVISAETGAAIMGEAKAREINFTITNGEIRAVSLENELKAKGIAVSGQVTAAQQAEAAARLENTAAISAQTRAGAVSGAGALGGIGSKLLGAVGWIGIALSVATAIWGIVDATRAAEEASKDWHLLDSGGGLASLRDAIAKDTVEYNKSGKAINTVKVKYDEYSAKLTSNAAVVQQATGTTVEMNNQTAELTSTIKTQTFAIGENAKAWIANSLASNEKVKEMFDKYPNLIDDLKAQGVDFAQIIQNILGGKSNPLSSINNAITNLNEQYSNIVSSFGASTGQGYASLLKSSGADAILEEIGKLNTIKSLLMGVSGSLKSALGQSAFQDIINGILGITEETGGAEEKIARFVKTTRSWASEVAGLFSNAFENRFGKGQALDNINKQWLDMRTSVREATKAVAELKRSMESIRADKTTLEAQLEVAIRYGDTVREKKIRAELAQKTGELADAEAQIVDQNSVLNKTLVGNSTTAIENRTQILSMLQAYDPYIQQILATSNSSTDAKKSIKSLKQEFIDNGKALGFNVEQLQEYAEHFDDMLTIVSYQPRDITLKVVDHPALTALRDFATEANKSLAGINKSIIIDIKTKANGGTGVLNKADGGYISGPGTGTSDSIPAMLSNGEFVVRAGAVKALGVGTLNQLNQADRMKFADGGLVKRYKDGGKVDDPALSNRWMGLLRYYGPLTKGQGFNLSNVPGLLREIAGGVKLSSFEEHLLREYVRAPGTLITEASHAEVGNKGVANLILKNQLKIDKGTPLTRVANRHDANILKEMKVGQTRILDRYMSVVNELHPSSASFIEEMTTSKANTGGRIGDAKTPAYPIIKFRVLTDIPGINDINHLVRGLSNVSDGLLAPGIGMKLRKITKRKDGLPIYHIDLGTNIKAKYGFNQADNIREIIQRLIGKNNYRESDTAALQEIKKAGKKTLGIEQHIRKYGGWGVTGTGMRGGGGGGGGSIMGNIGMFVNQMFSKGGLVKGYKDGGVVENIADYVRQLPTTFMRGIGNAFNPWSWFVHPDEKKQNILNKSLRQNNAIYKLLAKANRKDFNQIIGKLVYGDIAGIPNPYLETGGAYYPAANSFSTTLGHGIGTWNHEFGHGLDTNLLSAPDSINDIGKKLTPMQSNPIFDYIKAYVVSSYDGKPNRIYQFNPSYLEEARAQAWNGVLDRLNNRKKQFWEESAADIWQDRHFGSKAVIKPDPGQDNVWMPQWNTNQDKYHPDLDVGGMLYMSGYNDPNGFMRTLGLKIPKQFLKYGSLSRTMNFAPDNPYTRPPANMSYDLNALKKKFPNLDVSVVQGRASGGPVIGAGTSTSDSIPAMLSNGEYVVNAASVSRYGLDFMNSLNQQRVGYTQAPAQFAGNSNGNDTQMVYLSPEDRALLRSAIDRPVNLYTENTKIAQSANAGNVILAQRGTN